MRYKGITIEDTPTETYPQLVTLTKTVKKASKIQGKKFLTMEKAIQYIDNWELKLWEVTTNSRLEKSESKVAQKELLKLNGLQFKHTDLS